ncbi:hypothetical protein Bbelb_343280 [Branchiostoma belcheri]|nr:hypothetical protein Bbelb_343280 [Branchiostoma belcheri]
MCPGGLPATGGVPVGVLTMRSRRLFVSGARVEFKSELNSSRVPAGPKNSPVAAGCPSGPRNYRGVGWRSGRSFDCESGVPGSIPSRTLVVPVSGHALDVVSLGKNFARLSSLHPGCPDGYFYHQPNRLCYKAFNDATTYSGAVSRCSSDGGTLAMPRDNATNDFLIDLKKAVDNNALFRFGLTDVRQEGVWMWDDNVPLGNFSAWGQGQPDNYDGSEDCAEYSPDSASNTWNDGPCTTADKKFICQVSPSVCTDPLGMESGAIPDDSITAYSIWGVGYEPYRGRLNGVTGVGAWSVRTNAIGEWLQVDLGEMKTVTGTIIQGRYHNADQWVTSYKLQYSVDGLSWMKYASSDGSEEVFPGNTDRNTPVTNLLDSPTDARFVRFLPQTWHLHMSMRVEVLGCSVNATVTTRRTCFCVLSTCKNVGKRRASVRGEKIIFPGPRGIDDYARMETTLSEDLTSFTLCVHMRSSMATSDLISLVSYAVSESDNELTLFHEGGFKLHIQSYIRVADPPVWDGEWHAVCTTWRSSDGAWQLYTDGVLTDSGSGFQVGGRVRTGGTWILGQDQDAVGGGFDASQSFIGELSEVNLWDRVLSQTEIAADRSYHGNVIDWDTTNIRVFGQASRAEYRCIPACPAGSWTGWFNRDNPGGNADGETLNKLQEEYPSQICVAPTAVHARVVSTQVEASLTGQVISSYDTTTGFFCRNADQQDSTCLDYEVRFCCPEAGKTCQHWDSQTPHKHGYTREKHPSSGLQQNYCRNPSSNPESVWCYTTDFNSRWEYCDVPVCALTQLQSLGCWADTTDRAIPTLEGQDPILDGPYPSRTDAVRKCQHAAARRGYTVFAVQNGGWCASSADALQTYQKHGESDACQADGEGGSWANEVYRIVTRVHWLEVFSTVRGAGQTVYAAWIAGAGEEVLHNKCPVVEKWGSLNIRQVKIVLESSEGNVELIFDGQNTDKFSWFSLDRLRSSPWIDIRTEPQNIFSIEGEAGHKSPMTDTGRRGDKADFAAEVLPGLPILGCCQELWDGNGVGIADRMVISIDAGAVLCSCAEGYALNEDGTSCGCDPVSQRSRPPAISPSSGDEIASDFAPPPYNRVAFCLTTDIDECAVSNGGCEQTCNNTVGGFLCSSCHNGYTFNQNTLTCDDIDECAVSNGGCEQTCTNTVGGFLCSCHNGFKLNGNNFTCDDVNECEVSPGICGRHAACVNLNGTFDCRCFPGFKMGDGGCKGNKVLTRSTDGEQSPDRAAGIGNVDECLRKQTCPENAYCVNQPGTYQCVCLEGFTGNGTTCTEVVPETSPPGLTTAAVQSTTGEYTTPPASSTASNEMSTSSAAPSTASTSLKVPTTTTQPGDGMDRDDKTTELSSTPTVTVVSHEPPGTSESSPRQDGEGTINTIADLQYDRDNPMGILDQLIPQNGQKDKDFSSMDRTESTVGAYARDVIRKEFGGTFCGRVQDAVRDFPRESAGRPPGECDTFCGRVRYVQRESAVDSTTCTEAMSALARLSRAPSAMDTTETTAMITSDVITLCETLPLDAQAEGGYVVGSMTDSIKRAALGGASMEELAPKASAVVDTVASLMRSGGLEAVSEDEEDIAVLERLPPRKREKFRQKMKEKLDDKQERQWAYQRDVTQGLQRSLDSIADALLNSKDSTGRVEIGSKAVQMVLEKATGERLGGAAVSAHAGGVTFPGSRALSEGGVAEDADIKARFKTAS